MVGLRWAETWGLAFGAQVPLCSSRSVPGHELSKEEACHRYRSPAARPHCPPPTLLPAVSGTDVPHPHHLQPGHPTPALLARKPQASP